MYFFTEIKWGRSLRVLKGLFQNGCPPKNYFAYTVSINVHVVALPIYLGTCAIVGAKIERNDTCSFQETELL